MEYERDDGRFMALERKKFKLADYFYRWERDNFRNIAFNAVDTMQQQRHSFLNNLNVAKAILHFAACRQATNSCNEI